MGWLTTVSGIVLVALVLRDMFHTLFHPSRHGSIAGQVMALVWRVSRLLAPKGRLGSLSGPLGMTAVIVTWGAATVLGWTLIYVAHLPGGFAHDASLDPAQRNDLIDSAYLSLVTVSTLGYGDIVPTAPWLRLVAPLEALTGFVLLTAAVSWVLEIYPALNRRRVLALKLTTLRRARLSDNSLDVDSATGVITDLASGIVQARVDLIQYAATYYFRDTGPDAALAAMLPYAADLAREAATSRQPETRLAGVMLAHALNDLAGVLDTQFLHLGGDTSAVLKAFATDHRHHSR